MADEILAVVVQLKWVALALFLVLPPYYERTSKRIYEAVPVVKKS
jgi:hypothetical protein